MPVDPSDGPETTSNAIAGPGLFTVLWRRKAYLVFGAIVGLTLGYVDYLRRARVYQSSAQLYVQKRRADPLPATPGSGGNSQMSFIEDFLATHETLIRSTEVLTLAAKYLERMPLEEQPVGGNYVGYIASGLTVGREKTGAGTSANILNISFRGPSSADCEAVLNAVINGYRDSLEGGVQQVAKVDLAQIAKALKKNDEDSEQLDKDYLALHGKKGTESTVTVEDLKSRIIVDEGKKREFDLRAIGLDKQLKKVAAAKAEGKDRRAVLTILLRPADGKENRVPDLRPAEDPLVVLKLEEKKLLERYGEDHEDVIDIRRKIAALSSRSTASGGDIAVDEVELILEAVTDDLSEIKDKISYLETALKMDREMVKALETLEGEEKVLTGKRERLRKNRADLEDTQKQTELAKDTRLFDARAINPPGPGAKVAPVLVQCLIMALVLGLAAGGGLAYLAEMSDKSFRTPDDIRRRLGLAVVGHVPALALPKLSQAVEGTIDPRVVVHHRPKSTESEAYRGVRTALYFNTGGRTHQVIQITSPNPGDGKSTLSANLAVAIAQSGKRVVLVDCDFRKPRVHKIFGVSPEVGLASVITGDTTLAAATQPSGVTNLSLLPCGPRPANPAELLTSNRFQEVLEEIKASFDYVLIDTPPLLAVSDPAVVAPRVDGVLLTIRITTKARPAALRAKEILSAVGANVVGVVVNDMAAGKGSGLYGYGYGYGQGYGRYSTEYGYAYSEHYGDGGNDSQHDILLEGVPVPDEDDPPAAGRHLT